MYEYQPIAIVGLGAIMPDAADVNVFWRNILDSRVSIREVPESRWQSALYYHPDQQVLDKTYSNIGSFVTQYSFEPLQWKIPIPPNVQKAMDHPQKWSIACTRQALADYGYPERDLNRDRTAVIFGNSLAGELHYTTTLRIRLPEFMKALEDSAAFLDLPSGVQQALRDEAVERFLMNIMPITEDTMPGELSNVIAGRVANVFNFRGPNFVTDAACASSFAALQSAVEGLQAHRFDAAITGGIDSGMGIEAYVKFSKIGALSPDGSRPYDAGANGFVMGEGAAAFLLKRLEDAERDQDTIYAVIRGIGSSSDGSGKGITAPNPIGQQKAVARAWENAGVTPSSVGLIEGHGTSTRVGDVVEVNALNEVFRAYGLSPHSVALGSVKSNIGHLKSAAGAAGMLKAALALHHKVLPPSANFNRPNPDIPFGQMPFYVNIEEHPWENPPGEIRRAGVSSFGFGGTNFHVVLEEYAPGLSEVSTQQEKVFSIAESPISAEETPEPVMVVGADLEEARDYILALVSEKTGYPVEMLDLELDLEADLGIDTVKQAELFAAVREHFGIPRIEDLRLSDYSTLERVIQFVQEHAGTSEKTETTPVETESTPQTAFQAEDFEKDVETFILNLISEKTGYPSEVLDLQLDLEADLGVDTVKQAEMFLNIREHYGIERRDDLRLSDYNTLEKVIQFVIDNSGSSTTASQAEASPQAEPEEDVDISAKVNQRQPLRGLLFIGARTQSDLVDRLGEVMSDAEQGILPQNVFPDRDDVALPERIAIDYDDGPELVKKITKTIQALNGDNPKIWNALAGQGVRYSHGRAEAGKVVFMFPGQGSQYVNMLRDLIDIVPVIAETYAEADAVMAPVLGKPLTEFIFVEGDEEAQARSKEALKNTIITQPAVLTCNVALLRMLAAYGYQPDMVVGHSLGEYAALVAADVMPFADALRVVSARGQEMSKTGDGDGGCMAAVTAPLADVQSILEQVDGYAVIANINSPMQSVIGGTTPAIEQAVTAFTEAGYQAVKIQVSQAFHTKIVEPASQPLREVIAQMNISSPALPIVANVNGSWYPQTRDEILDNLAAQVHSTVQFVDCVQTLYDAGGRVFVEVGPKRVLNVLVSETLQHNEDVHVAATNHPRKGGLVSFNETIACLLAAGIPMDREREPIESISVQPQPQALIEVASTTIPMHELTGSVVISGTGLGLPGKNKPVFAEDNVERLLNGEIFIEPIPDDTRQEMLEKSIIRLVKSESGAQMIELNQMEQTIKLAGQPGSFDLSAEFGLPEDRVSTYDISTQLAIAAGIDALREAGIPLVMGYKKTTVGTYIPDRWMLPDALADETGVIFASAFPGLSRMADELEAFHAHKTKQKQLDYLVELSQVLAQESDSVRNTIQARISALEAELAEEDYHLDRNFVFRVLTMGHSQFAEYIGARGPNTHVNGACASTTQAIGVAEDWIRSGRCRRVVVIAGDDVASGNLMGWIGSALMASGAATVEGDLRLAALPFDRRRNGMIIGMGAAALVVEAQDAVSERGMSGICEILSSEFVNSAFHGTRLKVGHVSEVMERLLTTAETRFDLRRDLIAPKTVFVSHETYTPARGGSASAEIHSLRHTFGESANQVIIANTKGYTGHSMGVGVEDVLAVKALELGKVPPIANYDDHFEADPDLGDLNLSKGGDYAPDYALRLGAGFGSQLAMTLYRRIPINGSRVNQSDYDTWLAAVTGYPQPELEIEKRTLRVKDIGAPVNPPKTTHWVFGQQPVGWAARPEDPPVRFSNGEDQAVSRINVTLPEDPAEIPETEESPVIQKLQVEPVRDFCLDLISEKTGYPVEMLELELDLEADLGIDTVKQAEVFAELREHYQLPRPDELRLSDYNTIGKVIDFLVSQNGQEDEGDLRTVPGEEPASEQVEVPVIEPDQPSPQTNESIDSIREFLLSLVSEKTGYPTEMLDLELDLEADLGIDTVKQAELLSDVREHYHIPRREDLVLSDYNTLEKVIQFVQDAVREQTQVPDLAAGSIHETVSQDKPLPVINRRVPVPVLRPRLSLCKPTGIDINPGDRVLVVSSDDPIGEPLMARLGDLGARVDHLGSDSDLDSFIDGVYKGIFFLDGWKLLGALNSITITTLNDRLDQSLFRFFRIVKSLDLSSLAFVISATGSGGTHGYGHGSGQLSLTGAISGFMKSLARELGETLVKIVDFDAAADPVWIADKLISEVRFDPDSVEAGWSGDERYTIQALPQELGHQVNLELGSDPVFLVSGGAGGIIVPVVEDLARQFGGTFILFGRSQPSLDPGHPDLNRVLADRSGLKQGLIENAQRTGEKVNPGEIEKHLAELERQAHIQQVLDRVSKTGARAEYYACDVTNQAAVDELIQQVKEKFGQIDVLIHAAGIEKSRLIRNKSEEEFRQVFAVKVMGFYHLFRALAEQEQPLKAVQVFSSVAGRFGNPGQADYAAANDLLCRWMVSLQRSMPATQFQALDWSAWDEVGMAARGFVPAVMERAGIEMLPVNVAAPQVARELVFGGAGEVILAGQLGMLEEHLESTGEIDLDQANQVFQVPEDQTRLFDSVLTSNFADGIVLTGTLDPTKEEFLRDHALRGIAVMPGVMGIEGFVTAAEFVVANLLTENSAYQAIELTDIQFKQPLKFYRDEPREVLWKVRVTREHEFLTGHLQMQSVLDTRLGETRLLEHFTGKVQLSLVEEQLKPENFSIPEMNGSPQVGSEEIYRLYFHGPTFQVLKGVQKQGALVLGQFQFRTEPAVDHLLHAASRPLLVESCFQTAGVWEIGHDGQFSLPQYIKKLKLYPHSTIGESVYSFVKPGKVDADKVSFDAWVVDDNGQVFLEIREYQTSPLMSGLDDDSIQPFRRILGDKHDG